MRVRDWAFRTAGRRRALGLVGILALAGSWTAIAAPPALASTYGTSVVQVGVWSTDNTDKNATGVEGYLGHYPLPQATADNDPMYVWVGVKLSDGSFVQVGTYSNGSCPGKMGLFAQSWNAAGTATLFPDYFGYCGSFTIPTYAAFIISNGGAEGGGMYLWSFQTPEGIVVTHSYPDDNTGSNVPQDVGELVGPAPQKPSMSDAIGPVGADPALQTQHGTGAFYPTEHAKSYYGYSGACPPENITFRAANNLGFGTGIGGTCVANGVPLW